MSDLLKILENEAKALIIRLNKVNAQIEELKGKKPKIKIKLATPPKPLPTHKTYKSVSSVFGSSCGGSDGCGR